MDSHRGVSIASGCHAWGYPLASRLGYFDGLAPNIVLLAPKELQLASLCVHWIGSPRFALASRQGAKLRFRSP